MVCYAADQIQIDSTEIQIHNEIHHRTWVLNCIEIELKNKDPIYPESIDRVNQKHWLASFFQMVKNIVCFLNSF